MNDVEDGITNICGLVHASRLQGHKGRWDSFVESIRAEERPLDDLYARHEPAQDGFLSSEPVIFRARSAVEEGIFMIGDASGVIDPLTGNGMAMAMQSALVAAPFIAATLGNGDRKRSEDGYRARHAELFGRRIAWSRRVAFLLSRPALLDAALRLSHRAAGPFFLRKTRADRDAVARMVDAEDASGSGHPETAGAARRLQRSRRTGFGGGGRRRTPSPLAHRTCCLIPPRHTGGGAFDVLRHFVSFGSLRMTA